MRIKRKIIEIDEALCDGCGLCITGCAEGALQIVDGKARIVAETYCDGLGACLGQCPNGALKIVEREADEFDEAAVEKHLAAAHAAIPGAGGAPGHARCPSADIQVLAPLPACEQANRPWAMAGAGQGASALRHWPIQIRLVPPGAPFLRNAELLVLADCCAVAYPHLHADLLQGRVVLMGCPKFDDIDLYLDKFVAIFKEAGVRKVISVFMEVPCCAALPKIVAKAMELAKVAVPTERIVVGVRGQILQPGGA